MINFLTKKYKLSEPIVKNVINIIEDVRINAINRERFPGFYNNIRDLLAKLIPVIIKKIRKDNDLLLYINMFMEGFSYFREKPNLMTISISDVDWNVIKFTKKFLLTTLTPGASIIACDSICKILRKHFKDENLGKMKGANYFLGEGDKMPNIFKSNSSNKNGNERTKLEGISEELLKNLETIDINENELKELIKIVEENRREKEKTGVNCENIDNKSDSTKPKEIFDEITLSEQEYQTKENQKKKGSKKNSKNKPKSFDEISDAIIRADHSLKKRLRKLESGQKFQKLTKSKKLRKVIESTIEKEAMNPVGLHYADIIRKNRNLIKRIKHIFMDLKNQRGLDTFQRKGRLNNKFIKTVTSNYQFKNCFSRKISNMQLRILLIVDISGSMSGAKLIAAKNAMVILSEALEDIAKFKIVLFTGSYDALNILVKDFDETLDQKKIDKFGLHSSYHQNLDGVSIKHEANKLDRDDIIIVISDGQPAGTEGYGLYNAIPDIHYARKHNKIYAFSINAQGEYLNQMYHNDWILTSSNNNLELSQKMIKLCQLIAKEFYC